MPAAVGVVGAAGPLGLALVERLAGNASGLTVVGLDTEHRQVDGVSWRLTDLGRPSLARALDGLDVVVNLATDRSTSTPVNQRRAVNVEGARAVLEAAESAGVGRVVLLTSAMVYGAQAANPVPLVEDAALIEGPVDGLIGDWVEVERGASAHAASGARVEVTTVRPASLVGLVSDSLLPGLFEAVRLLAIRDSVCHWQFCHTDDLLDALIAAANGSVHGAVTAGCDGWLTRADVEALSGLRSVVLPYAVAYATAERLHRIGALASPASDLHYLAHPWVVGSQQLRASGWEPRWSNEAALRDHLHRLGDRAGRSLIVMDRRDATRAAAAGAGATLALIGSLALARARGRKA